MKKLAKLNGAKALSKKEQKSINGGFFFPGYPNGCVGDDICCGNGQGQCGIGFNGSGGYFQGYFNGLLICACA